MDVRKRGFFAWEYKQKDKYQDLEVMFCLFAEEIRLLPDKAFTNLIDRSLFDLMKAGGEFGNDVIPLLQRHPVRRCPTPCRSCTAICSR